MQVDEEMFETAELIVEWDFNNLRYKLFVVPREDNDEGPAHYLCGIDNGGVRRIDEAFVPEYDGNEREDNLIINDLLSAPMPDEAREILEDYL